MRKYSKTLQMWELEEAVEAYFVTFGGDPLRCPDLMKLVESSSQKFQDAFWAYVDALFEEEVSAYEASVSLWS